jgi:hypothetical protein
LHHPVRATRRSGRQQVEPSNPNQAYLTAIPELFKLDRYEQRAIWRRRHALGSFASATADDRSPSRRQDFRDLSAKKI